MFEVPILCACIGGRHIRHTIWWFYHLGVGGLGEAADAMVGLCLCALNCTRSSISDILRRLVQSTYVQYRGTGWWSKKNTAFWAYSVWPFRQESPGDKEIFPVLSTQKCTLPISTYVTSTGYRLVWAMLKTIASSDILDLWNFLSYHFAAEPPCYFGTNRKLMKRPS